MTSPVTPEQAALRARQGAGARYDAPGAPHEDLLLARRGTAFFARKLNELTDRALHARDPGGQWSRAHVVADISYHARAMALSLQAVRTAAGPDAGLSVKDGDIALGATLPPRALRSLFQHTEVHLNVEWRDLVDADWDGHVPGPQGALQPIRALPRLRAIRIWQGALDLDNGGRLRDVPLALRGAVQAAPARRPLPRNPCA